MCSLNNNNISFEKNGKVICGDKHFIIILLITKYTFRLLSYLVLINLLEKCDCDANDSMLTIEFTSS